MTSDSPFVVGFRATVHWCPADYAHRLHVLVGVRGGPGWYVFTKNGCLGSVAGPFESEPAAAEYAALATQRAEQLAAERRSARKRGSAG